MIEPCHRFDADWELLALGTLEPDRSAEMRAGPHPCRSSAASCTYAGSLSGSETSGCCAESEPCQL